MEERKEADPEVCIPLFVHGMVLLVRGQDTRHPLHGHQLLRASLSSLAHRHTRLSFRRKDGCPAVFLGLVPYSPCSGR